MGVLRARADAVLVGGSSIASAGNHVWTPQAVYPEDAAAWAALREHEGRQPTPLMVVLTRSGELPEHAPALDDPAIPVLVATTAEGEQRARRTLGSRAHVRYLATGATLDQGAIMRALRADNGIRTLLVEAGPQVHGALIADGLIDDAFLTLSPIMVGETEAQTRPSLVEGVAFGWEAPPQMRLLSLHRNGSYLYLHSRYER
jgi:riboflavin biosynthesis pyrimidine reductase